MRIEPHLVDAAGWALLHFLWQGLCIAALLELALVALRAACAQVRYVARCTALGAMAAAPPLTFLVLLDPALGARTLTPAVALAQAAVTSAGGERLLPWIVLAWALGAGACTARLAGGWWLLRRAWTRVPGAQLPARWQGSFEQLARQLGVRARALVVDSAAVAVPTVVGYLRPLVLVPARVLTGLAPEQIEALLAHELAHVRRADFLVNLLQSLVEALLFFHPAVWRVSAGIRAEREYCCDDVALAVSGHGFPLAQALAELESWRAERPSLAVSTLGGSLMDRIQRMVGIETQARGRRARTVRALAAVLAAGVLGTLVLGLSGPLAASPVQPFRSTTHELHTHRSCSACESRAQREHERRAELEERVEQARAELAAIRELLEGERTERLRERATVERLLERVEARPLAEPLARGPRAELERTVELQRALELERAVELQRALEIERAQGQRALELERVAEWKRAIELEHAARENHQDRGQLEQVQRALELELEREARARIAAERHLESDAARRDRERAELDQERAVLERVLAPRAHHGDGEGRAPEAQGDLRAWKRALEELWHARQEPTSEPAGGR